MCAVITAITTETIIQAAEVMAGGGVVAFPTETVYGIGVDARNEQAISALRDLKGRDNNKPLQVMVADVEQAKNIAVFSPVAEKLAEHFMPGAITLVLKQADNCGIAEAVNPGGNSIGIRIPDYAAMQELLQRCGLEGFLGAEHDL